MYCPDELLQLTGKHHGQIAIRMPITCKSHPESDQGAFSPVYLFPDVVLQSRINYLIKAFY
ncbi:MAG TPA: hypothetical protein ENI27_07925 [bacterium]|nr:hypothetical protein [bacterium]